MNNDINQFEIEIASKKEALFSIIESLLFVSGDPMSVKDIVKTVGHEESYVSEVLKELVKRYDEPSRGIKLITLNGMYQLVTKPKNSNYVQKLLKKNVRQSLSQASLESLAIIAYKQPITRIEIDEIRGVKSDSALQRLVEKNLIEETGRLEVPGRPILYGTTDEFLRHFALEDLKDLPSIELFDSGEEEKSLEKGEEQKSTENEYAEKSIENKQNENIEFKGIEK